MANPKRLKTPCIPHFFRLQGHIRLFPAVMYLLNRRAKKLVNTSRMKLWLPFIQRSPKGWVLCISRLPSVRLTQPVFLNFFSILSKSTWQIFQNYRFFFYQRCLWNALKNGREATWMDWWMRAIQTGSRWWVVLGYMHSLIHVTHYAIQ